MRSTLDDIYGGLGKVEVEIRKNEVTEVLGIDCKPLGRRVIVPTLTLKSENKKSDSCDIEDRPPEHDHEDIVKAEVEQTFKEDVEDGMDVNYDFGWTEDDEEAVKEERSDTDEEQAQGFFFLSHSCYCNFEGSL